MRYTLRQLEVFIATANFQNITKAAEALAMSQSAASGSLRELENQFETQLFDRIGKRLKLNGFGQIIRPQAEALLAQAGELESTLQKQQLGNLKVGATLTIGNYLAVSIMSRYMSDWPGSEVTLEVANTDSIAQKVLNFELDIGLIEGEIRHPNLEVLPWLEDELVIFCAPAHPIAKRRMLTDKELLELQWILREPGSGTRQAFDRAMHGILPRLNVALELQHTEAIKRAVESEMGVGCLSRIALEDAFSRGRLIPLSVTQRDLQRKFYLILHRDKYRSAGIKNWLALCDRYDRQTCQ